MLDSFCCVDFAFFQLGHEPKSQKRGRIERLLFRQTNPIEDIEKEQRLKTLSLGGLNTKTFESLVSWSEWSDYLA